MSNPIGAVFDAIGSVAEFVVDNALPIVETVALNYFAPGLSSALGISELATKAIGNAAISALNGGSIANIATAGLMPYISSPGWMQQNLGINVNPTSFIAKPIADALGNSDLAKLVGSAVGSATTGGLIAGVTGGDIGQAALNAGLGSITSQAIQKTWTTIQQNLPKFEDMHTQATDLTQKINDSQSFIDQVKSVQTQLENNPVFDYQNKVDQYNQLKTDWQTAHDAGDVAKANSIASQANSIASYLNDPTTINTIKEIDMPAYNNLLAYRDSLINNNQQLITDYTNNVNQLNSLNTQYDLLTNQTQADYSNFQMADAISKGDYASAAKYYNDLNTYNADIAKIDPNASITTPSLSTAQEDFFNKYIKLTPSDQSTLDLQAKSLFSDYTSAPPATNNTAGSTQPTTDTSTSGATTTPAQPAVTTPPPSTADVSKLSPLASSITGAFGNAIKQGIVSNLTGQIIGGVTGNTPGTTTPSSSITKPAQHVDVSTLKPFTGTLPANLQTGQNTGNQTTQTGGLPSTTTPTTNVATNTQTTTGGLNTTNQPQGIVSNTTTQTPISGLQSTAQPQTTAASTAQKHVDVSKLSPVTDTNMLKNLGLQIG